MRQCLVSLSQSHLLREAVEGGLNSPHVEGPPRGLIYVKQYLPVLGPVSGILGSSLNLYPGDQNTDVAVER